MSRCASPVMVKNHLHVVVNRQFLAFRITGQSRLLNADMEMQWCFLIFSVLWIQYCEAKAEADFWTPEFLRVLNSLNGTAGLALKRTIIVELKRAESRGKAIFRNLYHLNEDKHECHTSLLKTLADDMMCPALANELKPYLDIEEYFLNMETDEKLVRSYVEGNCTNLSGKSTSTCNLLKSGSWNRLSYEMLTSLIDQCRLQYNDRERESTNTLSPRYPVSVLLTFM